MNKEDLLYLIPTKRVKAFDGLAVTAEVWELSHEYTRQQIRFHQFLSHGSGILTGLNVIASIPPDTSVYILPGVAVDNWGQLIILQQPLSFDVGESAEGLIYLLLHYAESPPRAQKGRGEEGAPMFIHDEFKVSAVSRLPETPFVEIARFNRLSRTSPLRNAENPAQPALNEIDLRFRYRADFPVPETIRIAVSYVGGIRAEQHGEGIHHLSRAVSRSEDYRPIADLGVPLDSPILEQYEMLYLVAGGRFELSRIELNNIYSFIKGGGTVLLEACQRHAGGSISAAAAALNEVVTSFGFRLDNLPANHPLLHTPHLFVEPPRGYEDRGALMVCEGIFYSTYDYGGAWQGQNRKGNLSRADIRTVFEWGENLLTAVFERREQVINQERPSTTTLSAQLIDLMEQPD